MHIAELLMMAGGQADPVPAGLIVFLNDTSIPSGWTRFTAADDKMLIGAGDTYTAGATGGVAFDASLGDVGGLSGYGGTHSEVTHANYSSLQSQTYFTTTRIGEIDAGNHAHALGDFTLNEIDRSSIILIQADSDINVLPQYGSILSTGSLEDLSNIRDTNKCICGGSSNINFDVGSTSVVLDSAGAHTHNSGTAVDVINGSGAGYAGGSSGAHTGTKPISSTEITLQLKRLLLSIWSNASEDFNLDSNMIAMWESAAPPSGWRLCDGTNETPNLEDHFIESVSSGNENTTSTGDNTININSPASVTHSKSHAHTGSSGTVVVNNTDTYAWSHTHTCSINQDLSFLPSYYALTFIMKS